MRETFDVIVIGSGLGGLVCATILAKEGWNVLVLEKNNQYGGNLQTFVRNRRIFDTGVHYLGGLDRGQNLHRYFRYLGIADQLQLKRMDPDGFDKITFDGDPNEYPYAQGGANFVEQLSRYFPHERTGIEHYLSRMKDTCQRFPLYRLDSDSVYSLDETLLSTSVADVIRSCTADGKLRAVLAGTNLLYAGDAETTPFYVHALSVHSYIESAWRCIRGGGQIARLLVQELRKHGGKILKYKEVTAFHIEDGLLQSVSTKDGYTFRASTFISNIDPKKTLDLIGDYPIRKNYVQHIRSARQTISAFSLYLSLKPGRIPYRNCNFYHFREERSVWDSIRYRPEEWPSSYMLSMNPAPDDRWAESMTAFTYMHYDEVGQWAHTRNTVAEAGPRGEDYERFKQEKAARLLDALSAKFPGLRDHVDAVHASTPLTYRDYIGSETGSMYGFAKDIRQPLKNTLPPRTKIRNLLLTGQSINMHGLLGVTIGAVLTCSELLGKTYLLAKINQANQYEPLTIDSYGHV